MVYFFFSSRRRHTRYWRDWSSDVCSFRSTGVEDEGTCASVSVGLEAGPVEPRFGAVSVGAGAAFEAGPEARGAVGTEPATGAGADLSDPPDSPSRTARVSFNT